MSDNKYDETLLKGVLEKKINMYITTIQKTHSILKHYQTLNIITSGDITNIREEMDEIVSTIKTIEHIIQYETDVVYESIIEQLQTVNNKISSLMKQYGTLYLEDMLLICYGDEFIQSNIMSHDNLKYRYELINESASILSYKIVSWNLQNRKNTSTKKKNNILEDIHIAETSNTLEFHNINSDSTSFNLKLNGFKVVIQNEALEQTIVINCLLHDIPYKFLKSDFFTKRLIYIEENSPQSQEYLNDTFKVFLKSLSSKELLVYSIDDIYDLYMGYLSNITTIKGKMLSKVTREFMNYGLYEQRNTLIQLLLNKNDNESQYIAYLLYDMLSTDSKNEGDNMNQQNIYNSFPVCIQINFKYAMKNTIEYTSKLLDIDLEGKLPLEQRICLMKTTDAVKEKAMLKVKELRSKSEDSGSKARHYIEGMLKIPFGIYKKEKVLDTLSSINDKLMKLPEEIKINLKVKDTLNNIDVIKICNEIKDDKIDIEDKIKKMKKNELKNIINKFNSLHENNKLEIDFKVLKQARLNLLDSVKNNNYVYENMYNILDNSNNEDLTEITNEYKCISTFMDDVNKTLDDSVYGHENAKKQIERIIGQWITGEQTGYCFGFEGPPGVGKTSLAKEGISKCLKDEEGNPRPFGFIAVGGSSNGSTLDGHNYTYVGSMWGKIVDIIMESKCMNPIIFIDEIDKVSRTEAGREIIGILTHLVDTTQNDKFQDKYFSGIDLDLSKVLFIFSYNDVGLMDSILLDRIHRVRFKHLSIDEKITIVNKYVLPEFGKKMGYNNFKDILTVNDSVIKFLIDTYTAEAGVRKLKELIFEIISEINLELLNGSTSEMPVKLTKDNIKFHYLKKRHPISPTLIHDKPISGLINGLWANALGKGGIIQIETQFVVSGNMLDMKLTGQQGDVMKESMSVAKTLAWKLTDEKVQERLLKIFDVTKMQGIHIHCPEGATPKDGPSAGTAITTCLYSLFNDKPIKNNLAITGEMNLQGNVTKIGGLDLKILGGIEAGVTEFLFPVENQRDFDDFWEEWGQKDIVNGIKFHAIGTIEEALSYAIIDNC
jgi:ATP-dependent Lon protease